MLLPIKRKPLAIGTETGSNALVAPRAERVVTQEQDALNPKAVVDEDKILIVNLGQYRPMRPDDVRLLGRMLVNDLLAHVFNRREGKRSPVHLIIDELEHGEETITRRRPARRDDNA
jgi:hypothetical protein